MRHSFSEIPLPDCYTYKLFVGDIKSPTEREFDTIISFVEPKSDVRARVHHRFFINDKVSKKTGKKFIKGIPQLFDAIDSGLTNGDVLIHCQMGASRSVSLAAAFIASINDSLTKAPEETIAAAFTHILKHRIESDPNPIFQKFLIKKWRVLV